MARVVDTVLHGGSVVLGACVRQQDVAIAGEKIAAIGSAETMPDAERVIDVTGTFVLPGLIDAHSHFSYDDFARGTLLSAHGGITTTIPFLGGSDSISDIIERGRAEASAGAVIDYAFHVILWPNPDSDYLPLIAGVRDGVARGEQRANGRNKRSHQHVRRSFSFFADDARVVIEIHHDYGEPLIDRLACDLKLAIHMIDQLASVENPWRTTHDGRDVEFAGNPGLD